MCSFYWYFLAWVMLSHEIKCNSVPQITTNADLKPTVETTAFFNDETVVTTRNVTDAFLLSNATDLESNETTLQPTSTDTISIIRIDNSSYLENKNDEIETSPEYEDVAKQIGLPNFGFLSNRIPCECNDGICGCCTGMLITALKQFGCVNITYLPEDFSFELKMIMNDAVLYKSRVTGRNPPPVCVRIPRLNFIKVCASFYDLYFVGRNMHVCMEMGAYFRDTEILNRSFDCMRIGDKGVKIVKPEDGSGLFHKPGTDAEIDAGFDDIDEYDENAVV